MALKSSENHADPCKTKLSDEGMFSIPLLKVTPCCTNL